MNFALPALNGNIMEVEGWLNVWLWRLIIVNSERLFFRILYDGEFPKKHAATPICINEALNLFITYNTVIPVIVQASPLARVKTRAEYHCLQTNWHKLTETRLFRLVERI